MLDTVLYFIYTNNANEKCYFNNCISHIFAGKINLNSYKSDTSNSTSQGTCILQGDFLRFFFIVAFALARLFLLLRDYFRP